MKIPCVQILSCESVHTKQKCWTLFPKYFARSKAWKLQNVEFYAIKKSQAMRALENACLQNNYFYVSSFAFLDSFAL
jgi:hypothetical protein